MRESREFRAPRAVHLVAEAFTDEPGVDTAVSLALLRGASAGSVPETLRLYTPGPIVAFGKRDVVAAGYRGAVAAARECGFEAIERLAGGRAAVFHEGTIAFAWTIPDPDPPSRITERFAAVSGLIAAALRSLGVDARVGEVPGEYCPGEYSVNARGAVKLMGVGQRLARRAAHVGGVIVVAGSGAVRDVLLPVYSALRIGWDPATAGAVEEEAGPVDVARVCDAVVAELGRPRPLVPGAVGDGVVAEARAMARRHVASG